MQRKSLIVLLVAVIASCGGKKKDPDTTGSGSAVVTGSGSAGSGSAGSGSGSGGSGSGSGSAAVPGEKPIGKTAQLAVVELTDKATADGKTYQIRGITDTNRNKIGAAQPYTIDIVGGVGPKDVPDITEFPLSTPDHKNMNSTTVSFHHEKGAVQFAVVSFEEIGKPTEVPPERIKLAFDRSQKDAIEAMGLKLDKATDQTIAGSPGRVVEVSGEATPAGSAKMKVAVKLWMVYMAKANVYAVLQVLAAPGDPLLAKGDEFIKTLSIVP